MPPRKKTTKPESVTKSGTGSYVGGGTPAASDDTDWPKPARGLYVGKAGDIRVSFLDGTTTILKNVPVGILDLPVARVWITDTSAGDIVALY